MPQTDFWPFSRHRLNENNQIQDGESSILQKQLGDMEGEVKEIQLELELIRKDRLELLNSKHKKDEHLHEANHRELGDVSELIKLREDLFRAKYLADEEKVQRESYEKKLIDIEKKLETICPAEIKKIPPGEVAVVKSDHETNTLKLQIRDLKEEMEEMKLTLNDKSDQLQEYRVKYLQAQQLVEELKRQLDVIEMDNKQVSDQIQIEIHKMKIQFQEKLQELSPLPDLLKGAQIQLQEAKQLQQLAEDSSTQLSNELSRAKEKAPHWREITVYFTRTAEQDMEVVDKPLLAVSVLKLVIVVNSLNQEKLEKSKVLDQSKALIAAREENQREIDTLNKALEEYKCKLMRIDEKLQHEESRLSEKSSECLKLQKDLEDMKSESHRTLSRFKERSDSMRKYMQMQISEMERQLIQSRAQCRACQKERDEIRQRMQIQITNLQENFELVEIRLKALQGQLNSLKSGYGVIIDDDVQELNNTIVSA